MTQEGALTFYNTELGSRNWFCNSWFTSFSEFL